MPRPQKGARLASGPTHQKHMIKGLVSSLIVEERIRTSEAKAKLMRPYADKLITLGKAGTLHARRQALRWVEDADTVHKLFDEVAPRYHDRNGGYTRILKLGPRKGDAAPMAIIEFVEEVAEDRSSPAQGSDSGGRKRRRRRKAGDEDAPKPRIRRSKTDDADDEGAAGEAGEADEAAAGADDAPQASVDEQPGAGEPADDADDEKS